ncbi:ABC transporter substrate-binding protein [Nakamurella sp. YIM 132084]|uniref:Thiamine pyrimidine synthase n=1 Tax=Nakamurella leprariae TaxID=2803911 RepID=A0A938YFP9_9ACTN|nr:ABC transporter substrate-binding protein [Nakamurella leprariae]MBM9468696.1 ABC transporter substrate-binding protein [Nakamurella leprariae]
MKKLRAAAAAATALVLAGALAACSSDSGSESSAGTTGGSSGSSQPESPTTVRFALDWTPNTNHTGLYVAINKGYFADAGIDVEILPYNNSSPEVLIDAGQAEFGIGFQNQSAVPMAAGADLQSVLAVEQTWTTAISVLASRDDIQSPADLDGLVYGGFGTPAEETTMKAVIQDAGGTGEFESVILGTTAYEALYSGDVDFTVPFIAWEGIEAEHRGVELKNFNYVDYGFPDNYAVIVVGNTTWMQDNPEVAKGFVQAMARGYEDAIADPAGAAAILQEENADVLTDLDFLVESQTMLSEQFMLDDQGQFGRQTQEQWDALGAFLFDSGLLVDADGDPLTEAPDWSQYFTNDYLEG